MLFFGMKWYSFIIFHIIKRIFNGEFKWENQAAEYIWTVVSNVEIISRNNKMNASNKTTQIMKRLESCFQFCIQFYLLENAISLKNHKKCTKDEKKDQLLFLKGEQKEKFYAKRLTLALNLEMKYQDYTFVFLWWIR